MFFVRALMAALSIVVVGANDYARSVVAPHKGRALIVNFWATWCDPCKEELPSLLAAAKERPVDLVLLSLDPTKTQEAVRAFLESVHADRPSFIAATGDPEIFINQVDATWDGTLPYTLVYGKDGKIVQRLRGAQSKDAFLRAIEKAGGGKPR